MEKKMTQSSNRLRRLTAATAFAALLLATSSACAQYMSFFGDSTWKYQYTVITRPPEDYLEYPPETPNDLGVYCITLSACFSKDDIFNTNLLPYSPQYYDQYATGYSHSCHDHDDNLHSDTWQGFGLLYEDTVQGRLFDMGYLICDMSLSEGDTFVHKGTCNDWYEPRIWYTGPSWDPILYSIQIDTIRIGMVVDSVRYLAGRKTIFLSLLDHQNDFFFGTGNHGLLDDYHLSIRFIEGIGPTYGLLDNYCFTRNLYNVDHGIRPTIFYYLDPPLGLLQCMYKDDSLVYMAHESLGCDQSCFGYQEFLDPHDNVLEYAYPYLNLYPNPATQYVVLDMSTGEEMDGWVKITDLLGRVCHQQKAEGAVCRITVSNLPTGMYLLTYTDGKRKVTKKFLKK